MTAAAVCTGSKLAVCAARAWLSVCRLRLLLCCAVPPLCMQVNWWFAPVRQKPFGCASCTPQRDLKNYPTGSLAGD